jgi:two-component system response regulator ParR
VNPLDVPAHLRAGWEAAPRVLLVVVEPGAQGFSAPEFCRRLRAAGGTAPVVVLAANDDVIEQAACLELGADACLPRDVPGPLLWAQVKALLRRGTPAADEGDTRHAGDFAFNRRAMTVRLGERVEGLTPHEFDCAWLLAGNAGAVVTRAALREAMTRGAAGAIRDRTVDACISRLRRKLLSLDGCARRIRSVHGQGYLLDPAA